MVVVDSHVHVWAENREPYPWDPSLGMVPGYAAPVGLLLETMDRHGVEKAVLVQPSNYAYDNRYLARCIHEHGDRLAAVALIDPLRDDAPDRLEYWVKEQSFQGIRLYPIRKPESRWLNESGQYPLWRKAEALGVPLIVFIAPRQMPLLEDMVTRFPSVRVVVDHMGSPNVGEGPPYTSIGGLLKLASYANVHVKVSDIDSSSKEPHPHRDIHEYVRLLLESFSAQRLMWASNFPHILRGCGYAKALSLVAEELPFLTAEDRRWILGETALKLYSFHG